MRHIYIYSKKSIQVKLISKVASIQIYLQSIEPKDNYVNAKANMLLFKKGNYAKKLCPYYYKWSHINKKCVIVSFISPHIGHNPFIIIILSLGFGL